jgi:hypothetical protein
MEPECSDPFHRTGFKHERLKQYLIDHRRDMLIALLTLARAWFAAGQPTSSVQPVGGFERWSEVISGILQYAGIEGFLGNSEKLFEDSAIEHIEWETFLDAIERTFQDDPFTISDLWNRFNNRNAEGMWQSEELRNALPTELMRWVDREGPFKQRLGIVFSAHRGRRYGKRQLRIVRSSVGAQRKVARWNVTSGI